MVLVASIGASGAVFGLFGVIVAVQYVHRPLVTRGARAFMGQFLGLVILNLALGFAFGGTIDNLAHIGGLVTGFVLAALFAPGRVPTMRSIWLRPGPTSGSVVPVFGAAGHRAAQVGGVALLAIAFGVMWVLGVAAWG